VGVGGQCHNTAALLPGKRLNTIFIRGRVGARVGLDGCGKFRFQRNSIPGPYPGPHIPYTST